MLPTISGRSHHGRLPRDPNWGRRPPQLPKALSREIRPHPGEPLPTNEKAPRRGAFATCAEEDSNLHPVIPDQALNLVTRLSYPSESRQIVRIGPPCGRYGRIGRSRCCHGCCHERGLLGVFGVREIPADARRGRDGHRHGQRPTGDTAARGLLTASLLPLHGCGSRAGGRSRAAGRPLVVPGERQLGGSGDARVSRGAAVRATSDRVGRSR